MNLNITNLTKKFDEHICLDDASFSFEKGKIYGLLGRNGAGKTTLFNCINAELDFENGSIDLSDNSNDTSPDIDKTKDTKSASGKKSLAFSTFHASDKVSAHTGMACATPVLPEFMTGYEFIKFYLEINNVNSDNSIEQYADLVCFEHADLDKLIKEYSDGMKNKIQMLTLFLSSPDIILLDEPLTSLDVVAAHEIKEILKAQKNDHIIILSTHILQLAMDLCDEIVLLHHGKLRAISNEEYHSADFEETIMKLLTEN